MATVLLLHCDGTNGSTTFTDEAGHTVTANGNAQISTAQSKFGGASALLDGTGDYLSIPYSADWDWAAHAGGYTIEMWIYRTASSQGTLITKDNGSVNDWMLYINSSGQLAFRYWNGASQVITCATTVSINTTHHVALVFDGSTGIKIYLDGAQDGAGTKSGTPAATSNVTLWVGYSSAAGIINAYFSGYIDELRITKGEALYTANFTPPSSAFSVPTVTGVVKDDTGANAARTVRLYKRSDGSLVASTTSDGTTGVYTFNSSLPVIPTEHYVICLDDASGTQYNAMILDKVVPG